MRQQGSKHDVPSPMNSLPGEPLREDDAMFYEIRTYTLRIGSLAEVEKRYGEAYESRRKYSQLAGFFHSEVGPLNQIIHIWPYEDMAERARVRAEAAKDPNWPPKIQEFVVNQRVEIVMPFPGSPAWKPGKLGPVYELRQYTFRSGTLPQIIKNWNERLPERLKLSPLALLGSVEFGPTVNSFIHLWAYPSMEERNAIREKATQAGIWPPTGGRDHYLAMENKFLLPSTFSPAQ